MIRILQTTVALLAIGTAAPIHADAQVLTQVGTVHCNPCLQPQAQCVTMQPVVETQYRQQQVTTYRDVTETRYRQEACVQKVPVTTYREVTVDEGSYQTVWVPKLVKKQVAQTQIQNRTSYRNVPYQVTTRVPQVSTQVVPVQTVRHVPVATPVIAQAPVCDPCSSLAADWNIVSRQATAALPTQSAPVSQSKNNVARNSAPRQASTQANAATTGYDSWTTVPSRDRSASSHRSSPVSSAGRPSSRQNSQSSGVARAPSAAKVWQSGLRR